MDSSLTQHVIIRWEMRYLDYHPFWVGQLVSHPSLSDRLPEIAAMCKARCSIDLFYYRYT